MGGGGFLGLSASSIALETGGISIGGGSGLRSVAEDAHSPMFARDFFRFSSMGMEYPQ